MARAMVVQLQHQTPLFEAQTHNLESYRIRGFSRDRFS